VPKGETVTFYNGTTSLGTGTTTNGVATYTTSALVAGSPSITATYAGDTSYLTSTSSAVVQVVNLGATTTTLASSANPDTYGTSFTLTATVSPSVPNGETVTFLAGSNTIGTGKTASGKATFTVSPMGAGSASVTAKYAGDSNYATSTSSALTQVVNLHSTTTTVTSSAATVAFGASVTLTATVSPSVPDGEIVTFYSGKTSLGTGTTKSGKATYSTSSLDAGTASITATYAGDSGYATSTSTALTQTISKASSSTKLSSSLTSATSGATVTFTATVTPSGPNGDTVTFYDGTTSLGSGTTSNGVASYVTTALTVATHSITAKYTGDSNHAASTSTAVSQVILKPAS
jgi:hypothetical protein